jgi:hypothetical protein
MAEQTVEVSNTALYYSEVENLYEMSKNLLFDRKLIMVSNWGHAPNSQ